MMSARCQKSLAIGVIGVTPWLARFATSLAGTDRLKAHDVKIQKAPTTRTDTIVASGMSRFGVFASSATVLATSKPVNERIPNSTAEVIALTPPFAVDGSNGAADSFPSPPTTQRMVRLSASTVTTSKAMKYSAVLAETLTSL